MDFASNQGMDIRFYQNQISGRKTLLSLQEPKCQCTSDTTFPSLFRSENSTSGKLCRWITNIEMPMQIRKTL